VEDLPPPNHYSLPHGTDLHPIPSIFDNYSHLWVFDSEVIFVFVVVSHLPGGSGGGGPSIMSLICVDLPLRLLTSVD